MAKTKDKLIIPDWCPASVKDKACELQRVHRKSPISLAVIERLATDPRMRRVWDELAKSRRGPDYQQAGSRYEPTERFAHLSQEDAIAGLFKFAADLGRLTLMLPSADEPDYPFRELANRLRDEANRMSGRDLASRKIRQSILTVARQSEAVTVRAYKPAKNISCEIAGWLEGVFGKRMYKTTATITNVITEGKVTEHQVRSWMMTCQRPCQKVGA